MDLENLMAHFMTIMAFIPFIAIGISRLVETRKNKELYKVNS